MRYTITQYSIAALLCLVLAQAGLTQTAPIPAVQEQMAKRELARQGVDETELRNRLLAKGIDVDNMSPQALISARPQIEATVAEIKAEQSENQQTAKASEAAAEVVEEGLDEAADVRELVEEGASVAEAKAEAEIAKDLGAKPAAASRIYGHELFRNKTLEVFRATDKATAPGTYVLDTGDELAISIFGASQTDLLLEIGEDGFIKPSGIPRIYLRGRTLTEARELVRSRMSNYYVFERGQFSLSIDAARTISVSIYGEVQQSGTYTLSALNGPLNALIAAGGPTDKGSVRNIELIREGKRTSIDVYEFLQNPGSVAAVDLRDKDIINVPLSLNLVSIAGGVRRPMTYELKTNENLKELVAYAGGTIPTAAVNTTRVQRYADGTLRVIDVDEPNFSQFNLSNGDRVEIPVVSDPIQDFISITGEVLVEGRFGFRQNLTLGEVLDRARLKPSARLDVAFLQRRNDDGTLRLERVAVTEDSPARAMELKRGDQLTVLAASRFVDNATFTVRGAVRDGERTLPYPQDGKVTLEEAVLLAGGLEDNAISEALIVRTLLNNRDEREYLRVELNQASKTALEPFDQVVLYNQERFTDEPNVSIRGAVRLPTETKWASSLSLEDLIYIAGGTTTNALNDVLIIRTPKTNLDEKIYKRVNRNEASDFALEPSDEVIIYSQERFSEIPTVSISGAVRNPIETTYDASLGINDLLYLAGGLRYDASYDRVEVYRLSLTNNKSNILIETLAINEEGLIEENFRLHPFDQVNVRSIAEFTPIESIRITGEVRFPGSYARFKDRSRISDLLNQAGGLTADAFPAGATLLRDGKKVVIEIDKILSAPLSSGNITLNPGDVIEIPKKEETVIISVSNTYAAQFGIDSLTRNGIVQVAFQGSKKANWYINNYVGGLTDNANKKAITVTGPAGDIQETKSFLGIRIYPTVEAGSMVYIPTKPPKKEKPNRERTSWSEISQVIVAAMTTVATLIIISNRN